MKMFFILALLILSACAQSTKSPDTNTYLNKKEESLTSENAHVPTEITLGEATTPIIDTGINRLSNIDLACKSISSIELKNDEEFSFNAITGERSSKKGYKYAPIIFNGEKSYGIGGGICQVSTTIYIAALNAGLEITEHHCHSEHVAYVPENMDATVVFGEKDLKFKNNSGYTIYIYTWRENDTLFSKIIRND